MKRILIVHNNPEDKAQLKKLLGKSPVEIEISSSGFQCLHLLEKESFHLLIVIENMQDMPGHEIIGLIRSIKTQKELPILYMAKNLDKDGLMEMINLGVTEYRAYSNKFEGLPEIVHSLTSF